MNISVVIPLFNKGGTIKRAIQSVFSQERLPEVLVVVDDGSTDDSVQACRAVLAMAPNELECILIEQKNAGVSVARNVGANATNSDLIAFLDADDEWLPRHLAELERLADAVPDAGILSTRSSRLSSNGKLEPAASGLMPGFFGRVENGLAAYRKGYGILHTSSIAVSRPAWMRSGGFLVGARKSQDIQLWLRLLLDEPFAHSDVCTAVRYWEATGVSLRAGEIPAHLNYFLAKDKFQHYSNSSDLKKFIASNIFVQIVAHRLQFNDKDDKVARELLCLARSLPLNLRLKAELIVLIPSKLLHLIVRIRRQS